MLERLTKFNCLSCVFSLSGFDKFQLIRCSAVLHSPNALDYFFYFTLVFVSVYHENLMKTYRAAIRIFRIVKHTDGKNQLHLIDVRT